MATRSNIRICKNGKIDRSIYCHYDGYVFNMMPLLMNYDTLEKVESLLALGDLKFLGDSLKTCHAYHRDDGEPLSYSGITNTNGNFWKKGIERIYTYFADEGVWH